MGSASALEEDGGASGAAGGVSAGHSPKGLGPFSGLSGPRLRGPEGLGLPSWMVSAGPAGTGRKGRSEEELG